MKEKWSLTYLKVKFLTLIFLEMSLGIRLNEINDTHIRINIKYSVPSDTDLIDYSWSL